MNVLPAEQNDITAPLHRSIEQFEGKPRPRAELMPRAISLDAVHRPCLKAAGVLHRHKLDVRRGVDVD